MNPARALFSSTLALSIGFALALVPARAQADKFVRMLDPSTRNAVVGSALRSWNDAHPGAQARINKLEAHAARWEHLLLGEMAQAGAVTIGLRKPAQAWQNMIYARRGAVYAEKNRLTDARTAAVGRNIEHQDVEITSVGRFDAIELDNFARSMEPSKAPQNPLARRVRSLLSR